MTEKEKVKAYDEAIERAKKLYSNGITEEIFPELKESKDKKIREAILKGLIDCRDAPDLGWSNFGGIHIDDCIAWLEKQGEQTSSQTNERAWLYLVSDVLTWKDGIGQYLDDLRVQELAKRLCSKYAQKLYNPLILSNSLNTGKNEQKSANKNKPSFEVGDWVVFITSESVYQVEKKENYEYTLRHILGGSLCLSFSNKKLIREWTIQDAKDGDVLAAHECYVVFKEIDGLNIKCYCTYHYLGFNPSFYVDTLQNKDAFLPATKKQRDALMKAMNDAGYEWDAEKKELKTYKVK